VQGALVTLLGDIAPVYNRAPPRARFPYLLISDGQVSDWSHKSGIGREIRLGLTLWDNAPAPAALLERADAVTQQMEQFPRDLPGWRLATLLYLRTLVSRSPDGPSAALIEFRLRLTAV
jgi:Protein of unknown function (DUF3168)